MTQNELTFGFLGGIHGIAPVQEQPATQLIRWQLFRVRRPDGSITRHLVGHSVKDHEGRVSSAIERIDVARDAMVSSSGRVYEIGGEPCEDADASWVFRTWLMRSHFSGPKEVTQAFLRLRRMRGHLGPVGGAS